MSEQAAVLSEALRLLACGFRLVPLHTPTDVGGCDCRRSGCTSPGKHPRTARGATDATNDADTVRRWFRLWPTANLGVVLGDDLVVVDIDRPDALDQLRRIVGGEDVLPVSPTVVTARGWHVYLRSPGRVRSFDPVEGVNVKTGNSIATVPPSIHFRGARYSYAEGRELGVLDLAPCPPWLLAMFQGQPKRTLRRRGMPIPKGQRHVTLVAMGGAMRRQGSDEEEILAALRIANRRCVPPLGEAEVGAIARSMNAYPPEPDPMLDLEDVGSPYNLLADGDYIRAAGARPVPSIEGEPAASDWDEPVPLSRATRLPVFPVDRLPGWLHDFVVAEAEATQTPTDMAATLALAAIASIAATHVELEVVDGWCEPLNVYVACAMDPGSRKTAVHRDVTAPILEYEQQLLDAASVAIPEAASLRRIASAHLVKVEKAAAAAKDEERQALEEEARTAARALERLEEPTPPRLFTDDATPEALATLLHQNKGRMAVLSAEGGIFDLMAGRYSAGIPNLDVFLKAHAGDPIRVDRRGRAPEFVNRPALTMGVAVQPFVLVKAAKLADFSGRGLFDRFLFAMPPGNVGYRETDPPPMRAEIRTTYSANLRALASAVEHGLTTLRLSEEAGSALSAWRTELEPRRRPDGDLGHIQGWSSKLDGATVRLAGLLHIASVYTRGLQVAVSSAVMAGAIDIARYFISHALAVFDRMGADSQVDGAQRIAEWAAKKQLMTFSKRDCHVALRSHFKRAAELDPALTLLADHGWIRSIPAPRRPGRPSVRFEVNPLLVARYEQNARKAAK